MEDVFQEEAHRLRGPHRDLSDPFELPAEFVPLRLEMHSPEPEPVHVVVELARPAAVLGRHTDADVRLAHPEVSRRHCRVEFRDGHWRIVDLNSLNGLYVNGERTHEAVLREGDSLLLGRVTIFVLGQPHDSTDPRTNVLRSIADNLR